MLLAVGLLLAGPGNAAATPITINFSGLSENAQVAQYYEGGTSSLGDGPGPNYGVSFTPSANSLITTNFGPPVLFFNNINGGGQTPITMSVSGGFTGQLAFQYAEPYVISTGSVTVYDSSGNALATAPLPRIPGGYNYGYNARDNPEVVLPFSGVAQSVTFTLKGGAADLGSIAFTPAVPEPASFGSALAGLTLGLAVMALRRRSRIAKRQQRAG